MLSSSVEIPGALWFPKPRKTPIYELINASLRSRYFFLDIYYLDTNETVSLAVSHFYHRFGYGFPEMSLWFHHNRLEVQFPNTDDPKYFCEPLLAVHYGDPEFTSKMDLIIKKCFTPKIDCSSILTRPGLNQIYDEFLPSW